MPLLSSVEQFYNFGYFIQQEHGLLFVTDETMDDSIDGVPVDRRETYHMRSCNAALLSPCSLSVLSSYSGPLGMTTFIVFLFLLIKFRGLSFIRAKFIDVWSVLQHSKYFVFSFE